MWKTVMTAVLVLGLVGGAMLSVPLNIWAGNPHFVEVTVSCEGNTVTASGKEAGLGNEAQVHVVLEATALCINPGQHHPKAANKESVSAEGDFPVQNGRAMFFLTATASFQPECSPPMTVIFTDISVTDETSGITRDVGDCPVTLP
jgi:hypothetical protein